MPPAPTVQPPGRQRRAFNARAVLANAKEATKTVRVGRPTKYSPQLCERAVALGHKGKSWAGIARAFGIGRTTLNEWERDFPEFATALARARAAAQAWWEDHGQRNLKADRYQAQVHKTIMAAQFEDYREQRAGMADAMDWGAVIGEVVNRIRPPSEIAKIAPGDDAKAIDPLDVETKPIK